MFRDINGVYGASNDLYPKITYGNKMMCVNHRKRTYFVTKLILMSDFVIQLKVRLNLQTFGQPYGLFL